MIYMTNEEAVEILKGAIKKPNTKDGYLGQAIDMAIKALEDKGYEQGYKDGYAKGYEEGYDRGYITGEAQADAWLVIEEHINDTLDKIRAEIEQEYKNECEHPYGQGLRRAIEIIDKYNAERSDKG